MFLSTNSGAAGIFGVGDSDCNTNGDSNCKPNPYTVRFTHTHRNSNRDGNTAALPDAAISADATCTPDTASPSLVDTDVRIQKDLQVTRRIISPPMRSDHFSRNGFANFAQYKNERSALASIFTKYRRDEIRYVDG
jgi:hypothetical protein